MEKILVIITPIYEVYEVNEKGMIKSDRADFSSTWLFKGIRSVKSNEFIPFERITPEVLSGLQLLYKNQNPRYTVVDLDHGTRRIWGNTKYNGIAGLYFKETEK